ncbi:unnamed protein product [Symbiodinium necroappetens]|uniref:TauD/TfdA-like domain-containing protein n=1 Tax=Symbiodinium necroappetens TaxID=1628268 RepID=A0A812XML0_9DINO|nr:unnamed protein product [Symbiodinium necroappetens]
MAMEGLLSSSLACSRPKLGEAEGFKRAWDELEAYVRARPVLTDQHLSSYHADGCCLVRLGGKIVEADACHKTTPSQRRAGQADLDTLADLALLAVARELVILRPHEVCNVQSFQELYGGRLISDIIPEAHHVDFNGTECRRDHTKEQPPMRLHVDDCDHGCSPAVQLLLGIKNVNQTPTTVALVPKEEELLAAGIRVDLLREPLYQHQPPSITATSAVPLRPVLYGAKERPRIQADVKSTRGIRQDAAEAWEDLHRFLQKKTRFVALAPGDVLVLDNTRVLHGRGSLQPVEDSANRRWVKRLWLTGTATEKTLATCHNPLQRHPRVFSRQLAYDRTKPMLNPMEHF